MACRGFWECLFKLLNFLLTLSGLAMIGYGVYILVIWNNQSSGGGGGGVPVPPAADGREMPRAMLMLASFPSDIVDKLPKEWFIYLFIAVGAVLFAVSCFGCIGTATRSGCCLSCYAFLLILLILVELGCAGFIFFNHEWKDVIPEDKTGTFDMIYSFLDDNWKIVRWVALGVVVLEVLVFLLAVVVKVANSPPEYDSDEEYFAPRSSIRQPLIGRQTSVATGVPVGTQSRNDAWSARMREKYGLDASEFTYNPSDPSRLQQATTPIAEERRRCIVM